MNEDFAKLPAQYKVFSDTMKKAQEIAADRMRGVMGQMGLNIPGM